MQQIVQAVSEALLRAGLVQVEISARHIHLSASDLEILFGPGAALTPKRELSQPGQYLSEERVTLVGPKGRKEAVAVLGPVRDKTQVELSSSDCLALGIDAPVRQSGDIGGSGRATLEGSHGRVILREGCIIAQNHVHLTPETANLLRMKDRQIIGVRIITDRQIIFPEVLVRVNKAYQDRIHLDADEANAACADGFTLGKILIPERESAGCPWT